MWGEQEKGRPSYDDRPFILAREEGFEPPTSRLTADCSTAELLPISARQRRSCTWKPYSHTPRFRHVEAGAGIEPTYADLQSAASPLCHPARCFSAGAVVRSVLIRVSCGLVKRLMHVFFHHLEQSLPTIEFAAPRLYKALVARPNGEGNLACPTVREGASHGLRRRPT